MATTTNPAGRKTSSSTTPRSLFRSSNEDRKKREDAILHQMHEVTRIYMDQMEKSSAFFSDCDGGRARGVSACNNNSATTTEQEQDTDQSQSEIAIPTATATATANENTSASASADNDIVGVGVGVESNSCHVGVVVPRFGPDEIELETTMGMGEFGVVVKVGMIRLNSRNHLDQYFQQPAVVDVDVEDNNNNNNNNNNNGDDDTAKEKKTKGVGDSNSDGSVSLTSNRNSLLLETSGAITSCRSINNADLDVHVHDNDNITGRSRRVSAMAASTLPSAIVSSSRSINNAVLERYGNANGTITVPIARHSIPRHHSEKTKPPLWLSPTKSRLSSSLGDSRTAKERKRQTYIANVETDRMLRQELAENSLRRRQHWNSLRRTSSIAASTSSNADPVDTLQNSLRDSERGPCDGSTSLLVMKQIRKDLYPKKRIEAAKDLAREAKFLARLQQLFYIEQRSYNNEYTESSSSSSSSFSPKYNNHHPYKTFDNHPNLITLRGIVSDPGSPDFGLLLDRLHLTLEELATSWRRRQGGILETVKTTRAKLHRHSSNSNNNNNNNNASSTIASWWSGSSPSSSKQQPYFWNKLFWCDKPTGESSNSGSSILSSSSSSSQAIFDNSGDSVECASLMKAPPCETISSSAPPESVRLLGERVLALFDVAEGMRYLHHHKIVFRDLKTENVGGKPLASSSSSSSASMSMSARTAMDDNDAQYSPQQRMQIFDFGLARECKRSDRVSSQSQSHDNSNYGYGSNTDDCDCDCDDGDGDGDDDCDDDSFTDTYRMTGLTGTMRIMAPEVIQCLPYGLPSDVYSYGICMWEVFEGTKCNFLSAAEVCDTKHCVRPRLPRKLDVKTGSVGMPVRLRALMQQCWHEDPKKRPNFDTIRNHLGSVLSELQLQHVATRRSRTSTGERQRQWQPHQRTLSGSNSSARRQQPPHENNPDRDGFDGSAATAVTDPASGGRDAFWRRLAISQASGGLDD